MLQTRHLKRLIWKGLLDVTSFECFESFASLVKSDTYSAPHTPEGGLLLALGVSPAGNAIEMPRYLGSANRVSNRGRLCGFWLGTHFSNVIGR